MIRRLKISDIDNVINLCEEHFDAVNMSKRMHSFDRNTSMNTLEILASNSTNVVALVNINSKKVVDGIIVYLINDSLFDSKHRKASEFLWYAKNTITFVKLHNQMMKELEKRVDTIHIGIPIDSTVRKYL